jgi:hypothetical protein
MDVDEALHALGLGRSTTWLEIRSRYRDRIRAVHPDLARGTASDAAHLNAAFAVLEPVYRRGLPPPRAAAPPPPRSRTTPRDTPDHDLTEVTVVDDDGLTLVAPAGEVFLRLAAALDAVGDLTYTDAESGYLEALVGDGAGQLVVSLQGRAHATEAFFTLEPLDTRPVPTIESVVREVAAWLRARSADR